jgi:hypothetical protein
MYGKKLTKKWNKAKEYNADTELKDFLLLAHDPSPWKSELYMSVTKEVPGEEHARLSGKFYTKVFDGPFKEVPSWLKEMQEIGRKRKENFVKYYFYYTTCPKCAKEQGHNYVVAFAEIG